MPCFLAKHAGFCSGVKRAMEKALKAAQQAQQAGIPCYMLGELIHNDQALAPLFSLGVAKIDEVDQAKENSIVILRSHGEVPETYEQLRQKNITIVDTTCSFVKSLHDRISTHTTQGLPVLLLGDCMHPETIASAGYAKEQLVHIIANKKQAQMLPPLTRPLLVAQTTYPLHIWKDIQPTLTRLFPDLTCHCTICPATQQRQKAASELAKTVDAMVVVGGKKSANTQKLYESCKALCPRTCLVERACEIPQHFINNHMEKIGITAGASTPDWSFKEVVTRMNDMERQEVELLEDEQSKQSFMDDIEKTMVRIRNGQTITGTVLQITEDEVFVNVGYKSDGVIKKTDMVDKDVKEGDEIEVEVVKVNDGEGNVKLSQRNVINRKAWDAIMLKHENGEYIDGVGKEAVKGGLIADVEGVRAFVPASQLAPRYVEKIDQFVGQPMRLKIVDVDKTKKRIVASRKAVIAEESVAKKAALWEKVSEGAIIQGVVRRFADFGAFIDLDGLDGLVHNTDLAWNRINHPSQVLTIGDTIDVKVLSFDKEKERIQLGVKQLVAQPWDNIEDKYVVGTIIERKVVRVRPFGAFVELEPGVDGLVHISQCALTRVEKVEDALQAGQMVRVKILGVNKEAKRISLSVREALADEALTDDFDAIPGEEFEIPGEIEAPVEA